MPKKPFSSDEVAAQRERIMDAASNVMAEVGFHNLSMRKLAAQLSMTASNIYNYFPDKENLFLHSRRRGFELFFEDIAQDMLSNRDSRAALFNFAQRMYEFSRLNAGYYQMMFQPPYTLLNEKDHTQLDAVDRNVMDQVDRLVEEWEAHVMAQLVDAAPAFANASESQQQQLALFYVSSLHGLIDTYRHNTLSKLMNGLDLIPADIIQSHIEWLLASLEQHAETSIS
ncbi:MAG: TetR/AcrR family transcriptional regulator [Oleibacter sp.]|nr:TetR/AcrR family transcriptional regulator [Thalassolituus sp.]